MNEWENLKDVKFQGGGRLKALGWLFFSRCHSNVERREAKRRCLLFFFSGKMRILAFCRWKMGSRFPLQKQMWVAFA